MIIAPAGTGRLSPSASIKPLRRITVPLAIGAPLTVIILALRIATAAGGGWATTPAEKTISAVMRFFIMQWLIIEFSPKRSRAPGHGAAVASRCAVARAGI